MPACTRLFGVASRPTQSPIEISLVPRLGSSRLSDSLARARHLVDVDLPRASSFRLPAETSGLLASVENTGAHTVLETDGRFVPSDPRFDPAIPYQQSGWMAGVAN